MSIQQSKIIASNNLLGNLWAAKYKKGSIGINPALVAILIELINSLLPILLERCQERSARGFQRAAREQRQLIRNKRFVKAEMRKRLGFFRYHWYGGERLFESGLETCCSAEAEEAFGMYDEALGNVEE